MAIIRPSDIFQSFPSLNAMPREAKEELAHRSVGKSLSHKQILVNGGGDCQYLPFVLRGTLRVYKVSESGKELTLYRIDKGESCILSATCILNTSTFPAMVEAEGQTDVVLIPSDLFSRWVDTYPTWRRFVFSIYEKRLDMLLTLVEEVAFHHVDTRVSAYLASEAEGRGNTVSATHQQIASEVGTSREVVSRILRDLEAEGLVTTERGRIRILDRTRLSEKKE
ncbi:MAG TPA: Crp/Fnr family transcriptional regulator [Spirochaetia bacterium]|nr:Crp/Fnr family transcriptional regulator [Spirochaetia bacterium]